MMFHSCLRYLLIYQYSSMYRKDRKSELTLKRFHRLPFCGFGPICYSLVALSDRTCQGIQRVIVTLVFLGLLSFLNYL
jgi:hypothetical protein